VFVIVGDVVHCDHLLLNGMQTTFCMPSVAVVGIKNADYIYPERFSSKSAVTLVVFWGLRV